ncbi:hypothetical protein ATN79_47735 [Paraburkholderia caribensis]|nr:hypothetical protein ATN79_47735 [Paraburkholderia caribensis]
MSSVIKKGNYSPADELEKICLFLFDSWCETRSVLPMVYLLHAWPVLDQDEKGRRRLASALRDLARFHPEAINTDDLSRIERIAELAALAQ